MKKTEITDSLTFPTDNKASTSLLLIGTVALLASLVGYFVNEKQFFFSYLTSFVFIASISLSALCYVMLQHVTRSAYSVVFRRIPEVISRNIFILGILFIPILFGVHYLFSYSNWTPAQIAASSALQYKAHWLTVRGFIIRNIIYFSIWTFFGVRLYNNSVKMDETGDWGLQTLLRRTSGPGLAIFAVTCAFASFDWLMFLDPHWYSTIFGIYFFSMGFQAFFPMMILMLLYLKNKGILANTITLKHFEDLGTFTFAFTLFYAFIAFSQYFLIYYANIPEEILWYHNRFLGTWGDIGWLLVFGRFVIPFLILLVNKAKRNLTVLKYLSIWILALNFIEIYWLVMPILHHSGIYVSWLDFSTLIGLICIFLGLFFVTFKKHNIVPNNDPLLIESLNK